MSSLPQLDLNSQASDYQTKNFEAIKEFIRKQSPLINFKFFELSFTQTGTQKVAHNLGFLPKDILSTSLIGEGAIEFNYANFSATEFEVSLTGTVTKENPTTVRFFAGAYKLENR